MKDFKAGSLSWIIGGGGGQCNHRVLIRGRQEGQREGGKKKEMDTEMEIERERHLRFEYATLLDLKAYGGALSRKRRWPLKARGAGTWTLP